MTQLSFAYRNARVPKELAKGRKNIVPKPAHQALLGSAKLLRALLL